MKPLALSNCLKAVVLSITIFGSSQYVFSQCGVETLPYENTFEVSSINNCWNTTGGTYNAIFNTNGDGAVALSSPNQQGSCILESPPIHITNEARLNYGIRHQRIGQKGANDSLTIQYRDVTGGPWITLMAYNKGFVTHGGYSFEEIELSSGTIDDTIQFRFVYSTSAVISSNREVVSIQAFCVKAIPDSIFQLPFYENFDGAQWTPFIGPPPHSVLYYPVYDVDTNWLLNPWKNNRIRSYKWIVSSGSTPSVNTGPPSDYSTTGNYVHTEGTFTGNYATIETPFLNLSALPYPTLEFYYFMHGQDLGELEIEQWVNGQWHKVGSLIGEQQKANSPWKLNSILLDSTGVSKVRFRISRVDISGGFRQDAALDEIRMFNSLCPVPRDFELSVSHTSSSSLSFTGTPGPLASAYEIEYGPTDFTLGNGTIDTIYGFPFTIQSLNPDTEYDIYVRVLCGVSNSSSIYGPYTSKTNCVTMLAPIIETFDSTELPTCWYSYNPTSDSLYAGAWKVAQTTTGFPYYGALNQIDRTGNGGHSVGVDGSAPFVDSVELYTPLIDISRLRIPNLKFWLFSNNTDNPGDNNRFYVDFNDGQRWHEDIIVYRGDSSNWIPLNFPIPVDSVRGAIQFRFSVDKDANITYFNDILIDDVEVHDLYTSNCPLPSDIRTQREGCNDMRISWNSDSSIIASHIVFGTKGFDPFSEGTRIDGVISPFIVQGIPLHDSTEIFIMDSCSAGLGATSTTIYLDSIYIPPIISVSSNFLSYTDSTVTYIFDASNSNGVDSIFWDFGNGVTFSGDSVIFTFDSAQTAQILMYAFSDCGSASHNFSVEIKDISVRESYNSRQTLIYPNPSKGNITVCSSWPTEGTLHFTLIDQFGRNVYKSSAESDDTCSHLTLGELPSGVYILRILDGSTFLHHRVLIEK